MVFAVNCGFDDAPNSFANFKKSALAIGASLQAAAPPASGSAPAPTETAWPTAAYGDYTIPPAPDATPVTQTVTLGSEVWTTTYNSYPGSPAPTPASAEGVVHRVIVGGPGLLKFDPPSVSAAPRDVVVFELCVEIAYRYWQLSLTNSLQPPKEPHCHSILLRRPLPQAECYWCDRVRL